MEKYAVIVAGGSGQRMGNATPKQFLMLNNKPILYYSIIAFLQAYPDIQIVLVLPENYMAEGKSIISAHQLPEKNFTIVAGGSTRFHSVQNGLKQVKSNAVVFVHDAVRCMLTVDLIKRCYEQTLQLGSAIPAITATDSIRIEKENYPEIVDRNLVKIVQTPQTFLSSILLPAFQQEYQESFTDEATVVESFRTKIFLIEGEKNNIKVTTPIDLIIAENLLQQA
ncbi:MAG: 2-C-methyl-D-erythritol 4-phosphate cytidylyltransferase [Chitinophagaceae bacterium]|nr:2-C-methyl-D-erythritol 4-phosphate cytidylyltransferase [Chitinophagaceae bacterium]